MALRFLTNKHVIAAMVVTPILAVLGYLAADMLVKEQPHVAQAGQNYPLVAQSNCRYTSGRCDLKNNDFKASLQVDQGANVQTLLLTAEHALDQVNVGFNLVPADSSTTQPTGTATDPQKMVWNGTQNQWELPLPQGVQSDSLLMIVIQANGVNYFADTQMAFMQFETGFNKRF